MVRRRNINSGAADYVKLEDVTEPDGGFVDERFVETPTPPKPTPWKTIFFILFLMIAGAACLIAGVTTFLTNSIADFDDRALSLFILGTLMFIPGGYYGFTLICICLKIKGYSLEDIPVF